MRVMHEMYDKLKKALRHKMNLLSFINYKDKVYDFTDVFLC